MSDKEVPKEFEIISKAFWLQNILLDVQKDVFQNIIIPQTEESGKDFFREIVRDIDSCLNIGDAVKQMDWSKIESAVKDCTIQLSRKQIRGNA